MTILPFASADRDLAKFVRDKRERIVLDRLLGNIERGTHHSPPHALKHDSGRLVHLAQAMHKSRRHRGRHANMRATDGLFAFAAWDMLLDIYVHTACGDPVSIGGACIAAAAPPTTALRQLDVIARLGLVTRHRDSSDQQPPLLRLSASGFALVEEVLGEFAEALQPLH
jgi:hypothetical protein